ncbi:MAG TPA: FkbM family methyltransferase [Cyclobacteriaceae bacterium]|nr:FkbM family methyltransferase [Cyclobacteriaceae bacterium]HNA14746.1 FkbM family methyltransferase [Cyclobacteriaceae bacterium]
MYSQNKEEQVILDYFGFIQGTFADIGANDGVTFSNTKMLAERGWKGILLEPSPKAYAKLKEIYKGIDGVYTYPFAIGNHNGTAILNESASLINSHDVALVSTFKEEEMQRFRSITSYTPVEVKVFRWKTFLNRVKYKTFDFISIDAEGLDLDILRQIDLSNTRMVCVEWNGKQKEEFIAACPGFRLIHENGENLIFAR